MAMDEERGRARSVRSVVVRTEISDVPRQGQLVQVRERRWVVVEIEADGLPVNALRPAAPRQHLLTLRCIDDDAEPDETLRVVWEIEPGACAFERSALPSPEALDDPRRFDAFLDAVRWGANSNADPCHYQARSSRVLRSTGTSSIHLCARCGCRACRC